MFADSLRWSWLVFALGLACTFHPGSKAGETETTMEGSSGIIPNGTGSSTGSSTASSSGSTGGTDSSAGTSESTETSDSTDSTGSTSSDSTESTDSTDSTSSDSTESTESTDSTESTESTDSTESSDSSDTDESCVPHSTRCIGTTHVQTCTDQGTWGPPEACVDQVCVHDQCSGECAQGEKRCQGQDAQRCNAAGQWETQQTCDGPNEACENGGCVKTCEPWVRQLGTSEVDEAYGIAVDGSGNATITGYTGGALDGNQFTGETDIFAAKYSSSGTKLWIQQLGTVGTDKGQGVAVDSSGNAYITGHTNRDLTGTNLGRSDDAFVAKYSSSGTKLWTQQFGTSEQDLAFGIEVDDVGNATITGHTDDDLDGNNAGGLDIFVAKYSPSGSKLWTRQFGTSKWDVGYGIAVDGSGNAYIAGYTWGDLEGNNAGKLDIFVAKYSPSGSKLWIQQFGTSKEDQGEEIAVDSFGNAYITGWTDGVLNGNNSAGGKDIFIAKVCKGNP